MIALRWKQGEPAAADELFRAETRERYFVYSQAFFMLDVLIRGLKNHDEGLIQIGRTHWILVFMRPELSDLVRSLEPLPQPPDEIPKPMDRLMVLLPSTSHPNFPISRRFSDPSPTYKFLEVEVGDWTRGGDGLMFVQCRSLDRV
jgi:hypothetical protein